MSQEQWDNVPGQPRDAVPEFSRASAPDQASWPPPSSVATPPRAYSDPAQGWQPQASVPPQSQPYYPAAESRPAKKQRMLPTIVAVAVLSAGVGGGAAIGVDRYLNPDSPAVASSSGTTVTKVVQGSSSAPDWTVTAETASKSTVSIQVTSGRTGGNGSGVVLDTAGHIVTNNHVATAAGAQAKITVQIGDRAYDATIVGTDATSDLAVLKLTSPPSDLVPITFTNSDGVKVGDPVMAIGNPLGLSGTVTTGIVSALNRPVTTTDGSTAVVTNAIQTSAAINPGNSGGALVNANGELIGINSAIASLGSSQSGQSGNIGIGFAIESNVVKNITDQIISTGSAQHAWLGVSAKDDTAQISGGVIVGARVSQVNADSPAVKAGVQVGDLITSVAGRPVSSLESLVAIVRAQRIGSQVEVKLVRNGSEQTVTATLAASPTTQR